MHNASNTDPVEYGVRPTSHTESDIIAQALAILARRMSDPREVISAPRDVATYLRLLDADKPKDVERFYIVLLDAQHRLIRADVLFSGTLTETTVYPRELVKHALKFAASAAIIAHNHPSDSVQPSAADKTLTKRVKEVLSLVDVRLLDSIVISGSLYYSMQEHGCINF